MIVVTVPLLFPILPAYHIDPIHFGIILVLYIELGQISPPIGINLFVIQSIWDGKLSEVVLGTIPFSPHYVRYSCHGHLVAGARHLAARTDVTLRVIAEIIQIDSWSNLL